MICRGGVFLLLGIAVLIVSTPDLHGEEKIHTVQKGETLYSIARTQGIKAEDLMKHNGITDPSRLQAGQRLKIPGGTPAGSNTPAPASYRVVRGDTFFSIARRFSVPVDTILKANSLTVGYVLREGDTLRLSADAAIPAESKIPAEELLPIGAGISPAEETGRMPVATHGRSEPRQTGTVDSAVRWPVVARELNYMTGKLNGVVITAARTESVQSLTRGTVLSAGPYRGFGRVAIIQVEGGYLYVYGGCESLSVKEGDMVGPGTEIGKLGVDTKSNKPQLFFMVYRSNTPVDPAKAPRA